MPQSTQIEDVLISEGRERPNKPCGPITRLVAIS